MKLRAPINSRYFFAGNVMMINQLFGEGKNMTVAAGVKYGPRGHEGVDIDTTGEFKFERAGSWELNKDGYTNTKKAYYKKEAREPMEKIGRIQIYACHGGDVTPILHEDKEGRGWGMYVTAEPETEDGKTVQYRTMYWHIETPWHSLEYFDGKVFKNFPKKTVRAGAVIAIAGNNGMSSGPHLHLELHRREMTGNKWGEWEKVDPMLYMTEGSLFACQRYYGPSGSTWYYRGEVKTRKEIDAILNLYPKIRI